MWQREVRQSKFLGLRAQQFHHAHVVHATAGDEATLPVQAVLLNVVKATVDPEWHGVARPLRPYEPRVLKKRVRLLAQMHLRGRSWRREARLPLHR